MIVFYTVQILLTVNSVRALLIENNFITFKVYNYEKELIGLHQQPPNFNLYDL